MLRIIITCFTIICIAATESVITPVIGRELGKGHRLRKTRSRQSASANQMTSSEMTSTSSINNISILGRASADNNKVQSKKEKHRQKLKKKKEKENEQKIQKKKKKKEKHSTVSTSAWQTGLKSAKQSKSGNMGTAPSETARPKTSSSGGGKSNKKPKQKPGKPKQEGGKSGKHVRVSNIQACIQHCQVRDDYKSEY